ncbi:type II secretion system GspH family protein [Shewanella abyssi]|uniref:type II secretion system protein n=1 Tax=Shewanella abyssi TaxID=311789 RepID=UPI00200FA08B|nr:type II secretion system protein [Shewanella abyssi]MCL1050067.1 type II secretion system GspH family protein [Shewanella abyssi]
MQKQNGFTLIELVVVIIILGILAVTAAPKFINLQSDARESALQGVKGAIQGANGLVFAKAALGGDEKKATGDWTITDPASPEEGVDIGSGEFAVTNYGYLQATLVEFNNAIDANFDTADSDWIVSGVASGEMTITQIGAPAETGSGATLEACKLVYTQAADENTVPTYVITDNGC